jgi:hypothetical protein
MEYGGVRYSLYMLDVRSVWYHALGLTYLLISALLALRPRRKEYVLGLMQYLMHLTLAIGVFDDKSQSDGAPVDHLWAYWATVVHSSTSAGTAHPLMILGY